MYNVDISESCSINTTSTNIEQYNMTSKERLVHMVFTIKNEGNISYVTCEKTGKWISVKTNILNMIQSLNGKIYCGERFIFASFNCQSDQTKFKLSL